jgi:hypothetical protein
MGFGATKTEFRGAEICFFVEATLLGETAYRLIRMQFNYLKASGKYMHHASNAVFFVLMRFVWFSV